MRLLVSVRSAAEVEAAVSGGADIIDAKEPGNGSLGPVTAAMLNVIMRATPGPLPLSIALGDFTHRSAVRQAIAAVPVRLGRAPYFVKLGFGGVLSPRQVVGLLDEASKAAGRHPGRPLVVSVAYADAELAGSLDPQQLCRAAIASGASGMLLDTWVKSSGNLLTWISLPALTGLVAEIKDHGLLAALAGSLDSRHLKLVGTAGPDIVGVRGAACAGGRNGMVSRFRVENLRLSVMQASDSLRQKHSGQVLGETPDAPANLSPMY